MKKLFILLAGLACSQLLCRAEIFVYTHNSGILQTGNGQIVKTRLNGFVLFDQDNDFAMIKVYPQRRRFFVEFAQNWVMRDVHGARGQDYLVLSVEATGFGVYAAKGIEKGVTILGTEWSIPKTLLSVGTNMYDDGGAYLQEYRGVWVFDKIDTEFAEANGLNFGQTIDAFRDLLLSNGYTEGL
jgi:hypothetical protein